MILVIFVLAPADFEAGVRKLAFSGLFLFAMQQARPSLPWSPSLASCCTCHSYKLPCHE